MTAISNRSGQKRGEKLLPEIGSLYASPSSTYYPGGLVGHLPNSNLAVPVTVGVSPDLIIVGVTPDYLATSSSADSNGIALDSDGVTKLYVRYEHGVLGYFDTHGSTYAISDDDRDLPCWAYDNNTLYLSNPNGTLPFAGIIHHVDADGSVHVNIAPQTGVQGFYGPATAGALATYDDLVRTVASSIPAGTITAGVYTATANGAFSTAQNGVTLAVGDKFILPPGTITTFVATAAESGVYQVTSLGGASSKFTFARAPSWQHGATITPGTRVRVGGEPSLFAGSIWRADPATATKVVGTDDPLFFPERVIVQKTLSSGTATISTVPLRAAGKFGVYIDFNGGTPAATTTSIQASTQTPGALGTASIVLQAQSVLGTLVNTDASTCAVTILQ